MLDPATRRRRTLGAVAWFFVSTLLLIAPIFTTVGNRIEPRVLGLPFSLVYVLGVVAVNFAVLGWLYATRSVDDDGEVS